MKYRQYNDQKIPKGKSEAVNQWKTDNTMTKRYQKGNQKRKSMKDRQYNDQKIPKGKSKAVNQWKTDNTMTKRYQRVNEMP